MRNEMSVDIVSFMLTWKKNMAGWDFCLEFNSWLASIWNYVESSYVTVDLLPLETHRWNIGFMFLHVLEIESTAWAFWCDVED